MQVVTLIMTICLADHQTNAQLWANVRQAEESKETEKVSRTKQELADYLAARLGAIQGKTYPTGMSFDATIAAYNKQSRGGHWFENRSVIRSMIVAIWLLPPLIVTLMVLKKRRA